MLIATSTKKDLELQLQILVGLLKDQLKQKLLEVGEIPLEQTLSKAEAYETAHLQLVAMESQP